MQDLKISFRDAAPLGAGKNVDPLQVLRIKFDFPPLRIFRDFTPHGSAPAEKQGAADGVLSFVHQVRLEDKVLVFIAVMVELRMIELRLQKFGNDFGLGCATHFLHADSCGTKNCL